MTKYHGSDSQVLAKIAHLTALFERLVGEAGLRRQRIEQMLAELAEERADHAAAREQTPTTVEIRKRAA